MGSQRCRRRVDDTSHGACLLTSVATVPSSRSAMGRSWRRRPTRRCGPWHGNAHQHDGFHSFRVPSFAGRGFVPAGRKPEGRSGSLVESRSDGRDRGGLKWIPYTCRPLPARSCARPTGRAARFPRSCCGRSLRARPARSSEFLPCRRVAPDRSLAPVSRLGEWAVRRLADVDHNGHGCWVAAVGGEPVGLGRYVRLPDDPGVAEVALDVVDEMQGRGLGKLLLAAVIAAAADAGIRSLCWTMYPADTRVRRLAAPFGARFPSSPPAWPRPAPPCRSSAAQSWTRSSGWPARPAERAA